MKMADKSMDKDYIYQFRLVVVGDMAVGKTCLLRYFKDGQFCENTTITVGVDFHTRYVQVDGQTIKLQVWDTAGAERFRVITKAYYRNTVGGFLMFDITHRESFVRLNDRLEEALMHAEPHKPVYLLVGNKLDGDKARAVSREEAERFARLHHMEYIETSAKTGQNVIKAFELLTSKIYWRLHVGDIKVEEGWDGVKRGEEMRKEQSLLTDATPYYYNGTDVEKAVVIAGYEAKYSDELNVQIGESVKIIDKELDSTGRWKVKLGDRTGLVPESHLRVLQPDSPSQTSINEPADSAKITPPSMGHSHPPPEPIQPPTSSGKSKAANQSKKLFQEAMRSGYVVLHTIVLLLVGVAGAGKTCFCHMLFDEPPPPVRESTSLAKSSVRALSFSRATVSQAESAVFWKRVSTEMLNSLIADGIKSFIEVLSVPKPLSEQSKQSGAVIEHLQEVSTSVLQQVPPAVSTSEKY